LTQLQQLAGVSQSSKLSPLSTHSTFVPNIKRFTSGPLMEASTWTTTSAFVGVAPPLELDEDEDDEASVSAAAVDESDEFVCAPPPLPPQACNARLKISVKLARVGLRIFSGVMSLPGGGYYASGALLKANVCACRQVRIGPGTSLYH
jgi:hypothetical protein